ncbi:protein ULTRAPETALA 1-like protein isoform X2 [Cinnamomum micranthum f. kanehirae]|uniref:Protein ULTRAPETALA 1-like protein isoform X2 n=1 Tax=Cinnamomum micranthum f. kanehirae TaxID=337451 RepID=A0A443P157_9MAGN|nr:protein ULTRAPETALA 1-like protein isoform X2 [Cinnamomum micranthum f. kanehirae]
MENGGEKDAVSMFSDEDLSEISGLKRGGDFIEVMCGCTSQKYGDAVGRLKVFASGDLEVSCECTPGCQEDKLSPSAFEKHAGREGTRRWKSNVWVMVNGEKAPLSKTVLLRYYNQSSKNANGSHKGPHGRHFHRDEFIRCTRCNKERRFRLRTKEECRIHHDALATLNWKCSDLAYDKVTCDTDGERSSRKVYRGCSRSPSCTGCTSCVCFGCPICRFSDCSCQTCVDFTMNS